jgi:hypothetical protein
MWALGKRGWPGGLPLVGEEGGAQLWELAFRLEPAEALGGLEHGGGGPAQGHRGVAPALDVAADAPDRPQHVLDDVGAGQGSPQLPRQSQPDHGEDLIEPFEDRRRDTRRFAFQAAGKVAQQPLRLLGVVQFPGLSQRPPGRGVEMPRQPVEDVARLVQLAALDRRILPESPADRPLQRPIADREKRPPQPTRTTPPTRACGHAHGRVTQPSVQGTGSGSRGTQRAVRPRR